MLRTLAWYTNFAVSLPLTLPMLGRAKRLTAAGEISERDEYTHRVTSKWAMSHIKMSGASVRLYGSENIPQDRAVLFVSNHQSNFDIALFMGYIDKPKGYVSKIEMNKIPILRSWMNYMNCVFIERGNVRKTAEAMAKAIKILKSGFSLVIFPEGTRSRSEKLGEFREGSFKLAVKAGVPIVPVTIKGSYKLMEANNNKIKPAEVEMYIHEPIETEGLSNIHINELASRVREIIESKLE